MRTSITALLKSLKVPTLSEDNIATLKLLQHESNEHSQRMNALSPERVLRDQKAAFKTFLGAPTPENEQRLLVLADTQLTNRRHSVLLDAYAELQRRSLAKALEVVLPALERIKRAFATELERRETTTRNGGLDSRKDAGCIEMRSHLDRVARELADLEQYALSPQTADRTPMDMAAMLLAESEHTSDGEA